MTSDSDKLRVMAAAVYEIRILLGGMRSLSEDPDGDPCVRLAGNLAYALHNYALDALKDGPPKDWSAVPDAVGNAARLAGEVYADDHGVLTRRIDSS